MTRPTSAADLLPARRFLQAAKDARAPISGLRMLSMAGGSIDQATTYLRALEDISKEIRCVGPIKDCPKMFRGHLVGQMYEAC